MRTFLVETALVNSAAKLLGVSLTDNYAIFGAMPRYRHLCLGEIREAEGIDDVPKKADSFRFGVHCGSIMERYTSTWGDSERLLCEAQIVRNFFAPIYQAEGITSEQKKESLLTIANALVKRAQIRTHTAKPGYEDINAWLERYYWLQKDYRDYLPHLVEATVEPTKDEISYMERFLSQEDGLIRLSLSEPFTQEDLQRELEREPGSVFGRMLKEILVSWEK